MNKEEMKQKNREVENLARENCLPISLVTDIIVEDNDLSDDEKIRFLNLLGRLSMNVRYSNPINLSAALWYAHEFQVGSDLRLGHLMGYLNLPDDEFPRDLPIHTVKAVWNFLVRCMERTDEQYMMR